MHKGKSTEFNAEYQRRSAQGGYTVLCVTQSLMSFHFFICYGFSFKWPPKVYMLKIWPLAWAAIG